MMVNENSTDQSYKNNMKEDNQSSQQVEMCHESTQIYTDKKYLLTSQISGCSQYRTNQEQQQEDEETKNKVLQIQQISKQQIKPLNMFYLRGELFIDLNLTDHSRISNLNYYKQIRSSTIVKEYGMLYVDYQIDGKLFDDHKQVVEILKHSQNQDIYSLSEKLDEHYNQQQIHSQVKQQILKFSNMNNITTQLIASKKQQFMLLRKEKLSNLSKDNFDYSNQTFKMIGNGMNEKFCQLLGCDLQSMQDITLRKGILDYVENKSRWKIMQRIVEFGNKGISRRYHFEDSIGLITLDDILIEANFTTDFYNCESNKVFESLFHPDYQDYLIDRGFVIFELKITDFHVRMINNIRQKYIEEYQKSGNYNNISSSIDYLYKPYILPYYEVEIDSMNNYNQSEQQNINNNSNQNSQEMEIEQSNSLQPQHYSCVQSLQQNKGEVESTQPQFIEELITDIPYQMQSQYFLDKFYNNKSQKKTNALQDQYPAKTCKYRLIQQS